METGKNHMPNCQNFWELCNLLFPGLWSLLKQNLCMMEEKLYRAKECLNVSFGPCIKGFAYCKPIVQVDGTCLYGKYTGTLLIATAQDGANHIFPIAYAIVEGETTSAWWFFSKEFAKTCYSAN